jgi:anaerobic magnesium-protoporphyrin IX monomethyl ester cyclase
MKVLFVNPFYPLSEMPSPPLGVGYLTAAMQRAGFDVRVYDLVVSKYEPGKLEAVMEDFQPDMVAATSVTMTFYSAIAAIEDAKRIDPRVITAMGGAHVSFCAEQTLTEHPGLDVVGLGEGENTIVELCEAIEGKRSWASVPGICYRDGDRLQNNGERGSFLDVATLPLPARDLVPLARYRALGTPISMTTSRGCPFQCIFCVGRKLVGAKIRWRDPLSVVDEMETLAAMGFPQINVADDLFTAKQPHAYAVCDEIIRRGLKVSWVSFANVNTVDVPLLTRMREAGCTTVSFGLESGNQDILKTVKKGTRIHKMREAVQACTEAGILPSGSFIVGLPGETAETMKETIELGRELAAMGAPTGYHMLAPFPGTAVREQASKYKLKIFTDDWSQYNANHAITETDGAAREVQELIAKEFEQKGQRMFFELAERIENGTATEDERTRYAATERAGVYYDLMLQDVLETRGTFVTATTRVSSEQALSLLVPEVTAATGKPKSVVEKTLAHGLQHGILRYRSDEHLCTWQFADSDASLSVTEVARKPARAAAAVQHSQPMSAAE